MAKRPTLTDPSATEPGDEDAFLSRWARRKGIARAGSDPDGAETTPVEARDETAAPIPESSAAEEPPELTDADMPPVESIDDETDMSGFFSPKVSAAVKKAALRKFFHSSAFNFTDGLDDYDDDFRTFAELGDIVTSDMRGRAELEARRAKEALEKKPEGGSATAEAPAVTDDEGVAEDPAVAAEGAPAEEPLQGEGITRDPARPGGIARGKLLPREAAGHLDDDDDVGEAEDEA